MKEGVSVAPELTPLVNALQKNSNEVDTSSYIAYMAGKIMPFYQRFYCLS